MNNVRIFHVFDREDQRGGITIAFEQVEVKEEGVPNQYKAAIAICSVKDQFARKIGRAMAKGRLEKAESREHYEQLYHGTPLTIVTDIVNGLVNLFPGKKGFKLATELMHIPNSRVFQNGQKQGINTD